jgi:hypothetical protein
MCASGAERLARPAIEGRTTPPRATWMLATLAIVAVTAVGAAHAQDTAGSATNVTGVASVQRPDGRVSVLARGSSIGAGDTIRTEAESRVQVELRDGATVTVRPDSVFRLEAYRFNRDRAGDDSAIFRLLKGGLRAVTGLMGKRRPESMSFGTATATIGIRGTDFVARACEDDCAREAKGQVNDRLTRTPGYVGRVVTVQGRLAPVAGARAGQALVAGDPVFAQDILETGPAGFAVLVFQDGTRAVLQQSTRFAIDRYRYEPSRPEDGNVAFRLLKGGLRTLTGLIAQRAPKQFQIGTTVATIGVRGTGFDMVCEGPCADGAPPGSGGGGDGLTVWNWQGRNVIDGPGGTTLEIVEGQAMVIANGVDPPRLLPGVPQFMLDNAAPRPDTLNIDLQQLFGVQQEGFSDPGTYIHVRDGKVVVRGKDGETQTLGEGEVGWFDPTGTRFVRLGIVPVFLDNDPTLRSGDPLDYGCTVN